MEIEKAREITGYLHPRKGEELKLTGGCADTKEDPLQIGMRRGVGIGAGRGMEGDREGATGVAREVAGSEARGRRACLRFEGFLIGEMLKTMAEAGGEGSGIVPVSRGEKMFRRQQLEALGDVLAEQEPLGIARLLGSTIRGTGFTGGGQDENRDLQLQPDEAGDGDGRNGRAG